MDDLEAADRRSARRFAEYEAQIRSGSPPEAPEDAINPQRSVGLANFWFGAATVGADDVVFAGLCTVAAATEMDRAAFQIEALQALEWEVRPARLGKAMKRLAEQDPARVATLTEYYGGQDYTALRTATATTLMSSIKNLNARHTSVAEAIRIKCEEIHSHLIHEIEGGQPSAPVEPEVVLRPEVLQALMPVLKRIEVGFASDERWVFGAVNPQTDAAINLHNLKLQPVESSAAERRWAEVRGV